MGERLAAHTAPAVHVYDPHLFEMHRGCAHLLRPNAPNATINPKHNVELFWLRALA